MTATSDEAKVDRALLLHLAGLTTNPVTTIAWPDDDSFDIPRDSQGNMLPHLEPRIVPLDPGFVTLSGSIKRHRGLMQVMVITPPGKGAITPKNIAGQVIDHFKNAVLFFDGIKVTIEGQPYAMSPDYGDTKTEIPVTINYLAFS